ncbi:hypothetical protein TWF506_008494 [Arthrobotrys conoides]|uniref:Uncharacterized protein n=1 Tax=Arthrobotrys conoides TaxID=74498 RepID=A0AAN8RU20_9PEZI
MSPGSIRPPKQAKRKVFIRLIRTQRLDLSSLSFPPIPTLFPPYKSDCEGIFRLPAARPNEQLGQNPNYNHQIEPTFSSCQKTRISWPQCPLATAV